MNDTVHIPASVYIETYGCQMNKLDSELAAAILGDAGYRLTDDMTAADVILLNTCGVRDNAEQRIHGRLGELHALKTGRPTLLFGVIGCMAQRMGEELINRDVRVVAGPDAYRRLPDLIAEARGDAQVDTTLDTAETYDEIMADRVSPVSAWVAVMRGCDNYCSYCIVPYTRGRERSIPAERIIDEVETLVERGYREVTLLGQNVNSYADGTTGFAELLDRVADTGIGWVRFLTSHPKDLGDDILAVMASRENVCGHLHLPLQSGSDQVLELMNRRYTVDHYLGIVSRARELMPDISITTDLMFGFPGETAADFGETLRVMEDVRFDFAFLYRYSERAGTRAVDMPDAVPEQERIARLSEAIELQNRISHEKNAARIGSEMTVLIKDRSKDGTGWYGFSESGIPVVLAAPDGAVVPGSFVKVAIESTTGASLVGSVR